MAAEEKIISESNKRKVQIIFDKPANEDAFNSGGHNRSANALANAIEQLVNRDGAIGLEGPWGSGKSTVIKISEDILKKIDTDRKYSVFTFDLWAHQSDNFRRAFLENFVDWLEDTKLISPHLAQKKRDEIRDRVKTIRQDNLRQYSLFGVFFLLLVPILPLAYAWLSPMALSKNYIFFGQDVQTILFVVLGLCYYLFLIRFAFHLDRKKSVTDAASRAVSMFSKEIEFETTTQNIREADPTTIEFHRIFRELLSASQNKYRHVILVLDNIDRLPKEAVLTVWSEIRSLFSIKNPNKSENAWVTAVVPYDKTFITRIFIGDKEKDSETQTKIECDVFNKTFDCILRVSPPVSTDWRMFLNQCLKNAFEPNVPDDTAFRLFRILQYYFQEKGIHPTPRQIVNLVNEIGALVSQWGNEISIESMALFILHRSQIENNPVAIQKIETVNQRYLRMSCVSDWQRDFAALAFNVKPENARQTYLGQSIAKALTLLKPDSLKDLSKAAGFQEVLSDIIASYAPTWASEDAELISILANNIEAINLAGELRAGVWAELAPTLSQLAQFNYADIEEFNGLYIILENQAPQSLLKCADDLRTRISNCPLNQDEHWSDGVSWFKGIEKIADIIEKKISNAAKLAFLKQTVVQDNIEFCLGAAHQCAQSDSIRFENLKIQSAPKTIRSEFGKYIEGFPTIFGNTLNEVNFLLDDATKINYLDLICNRLRKAEAFDELERSSLLDSFANIAFTKEKQEFKDRLSAIVDDGTLIWHGNAANKEPDYSSEALSQWLIITRQQSAAVPSTPDPHASLGDMKAARLWYSDSYGSAEINDTKLEKIADLVAEYDQFSSWQTLAINDKTKNNFFKKIFREVIKKEQFSKLGVVQTVEEYHQYRDILSNEERIAFLKKFEEWEELFEKNFSAAEVLRIPSEFIEDVTSLDPPTKYEVILQKIDEYLKGLGTEAWQNALQEEDDNLRLLIARSKTAGISLQIDIYQPALLAHAVSVLSGDVTPTQYTSEWDYVVSCLKPATRHRLAQDIFNKLSLIAVADDGAQQFCLLYRSILSEMPFKNNPEIALNQIFAKLILSEDEDVRNFVIQNLGTIKDCLDKAPEISRAGFEEVIESLEEKTDTTFSAWAESLRQELRLEKKSPPAEALEEDKKNSQDNEKQ